MGPSFGAGMVPQVRGDEAMNATSRDAIRSQEAPRQRGGAAMRPATVVATGGGDLTVAINGGRIRALCAISCTAEPLAGDEVLVWAEEDGCHILAVLRRAGPADDSQTRPCDIDPDEGAPEPAFAGPFNGLPPVMAGGALPYQPHFDSQSDGEAAAGRPWTRFDVPLTVEEHGHHHDEHRADARPVAVLAAQRQEPLCLIGRDSQRCIGNERFNHRNSLRRRQAGLPQARRQLRQEQGRADGVANHRDHGGDDHLVR
ncbi:MAG: hypothetical protein B7Z14_03005 [Bosea sp. 32-68-6]|nr:MAG: hypothetical protein B7Z14_03005 [Bosea sp. 32-68-6]